MRLIFILIITFFGTLSSFSQLTKVLDLPNFTIYDSEIYNNKMYISGAGFVENENGDTIYGVFGWDGINITSLPVFLDSSGNNTLKEVRNLQTYSSRLYLGNSSGLYSFNDFIVDVEYQFDSDLFFIDYYITDLIVFDEKLYISGSFFVDSNNFHLMYYYNDNIFPAAHPLFKDVRRVVDLEVFENKLYATRISSDQQEIQSKIFIFDKLNWDSLP